MIPIVPWDQMWPCGQHRAAEAPRDDALFVAASMELPLVRFLLLLLLLFFVLFCFVFMLELHSGIIPFTVWHWSPLHLTPALLLICKTLLPAYSPDRFLNHGVRFLCCFKVVSHVARASLSSRFSRLRHPNPVHTCTILSSRVNRVKKKKWVMLDGFKSKF